MRYIHRLKMSLRVSPHLASPRWGEGVGQASRLSCKWVAAISILLLSSAFFAAPAFAALTVTIPTSEIVVSGQGILPNSLPTALSKVQVTFGAPGDTLTSFEAKVIDAGGLGSGDIRELAIYSDSNNNGFFDSGDSKIAYKTGPVPGTPYGGLHIGDLPWDSPVFPPEAHNGASDHIWFYFIVVETSGSIAHGDAFQGQLIDSIYSGANSGPKSPSNIITCESEVVDVYYTESESRLYGTGPGEWNLVTNAYETYWQLNYIPYAIAQEMTEPTQTYNLSEAWRYSKLGGGESATIDSEAYSNLLKFERRRKLMGIDTPTAVLGIKVAGKNQWQAPSPIPPYDNDYFNTMVIKFVDTNGANFTPGSALRPISTSSEVTSGVAVYKDINVNGIFDDGPSSVLQILSSAWNPDGMTLTINFVLPASNPNAAIPPLFNAGPVDGTRNDATGVDFFVVLRSTNAIQYGADFTAQVTGMSFTGANPPASSNWYETGEIKAVFELSDYTGTRVDPDPGTTFPVIGINVNRGAVTESLSEFNFYLQKTDASGVSTNFNPNNDLTAPGVTVRNRSGVVPTVTSGSWVEDSVTYPPEVWWKTTVTFTGTTEEKKIPIDDTGANSGPEYFVNLTTSSSFGYNKKIVAAIPDGEFYFEHGLSAPGTALITNANIDHGSNSRVYPDINPSAPNHNPILGNPSVVFSQENTKIRKNSNPTAIIGIDLASNTISGTPVELKSMVVQIVNTGGFIWNNDLATMGITPDLSGIGLYLDTGDGEFHQTAVAGHSADTPLTLAFPPTHRITESSEGYDRFLLILQNPLVLPDGATGASKIFVTLRSSSGMNLADAIDLRIWGSEIKPCSSYGLGFRAQDAGARNVEALTPTVVGGSTTINTLTLTSTPATLDYSDNWYLAITAGVNSAVGQVYKVTNVLGSTVTVDNINPDLPPINLLGIGSFSAVKLFKVKSTSYQNFVAPVVCSGIYRLKITAPAVAVTTPPHSVIISYDADTDGGISAPLTLYRIPSSDYPNIANRVRIDSGLPVGFEQTYSWDTSMVPTGIYRIYGELGSGSDIDTDFSLGTVTIRNNPPNATALTITPATPAPPAKVGNTALITLTGLTDPNADPLTVTFYYTDSAGNNAIDIPGTYTPASPYSTLPYPPTVTYNWDTTGVTAGNYLLFARISDGAGGNVVNFPSTPAPFTINHPPLIIINQPLTAGLPPTNSLYTITWTASGLDGEGETVRLYYDINNDRADGYTEIIDAVGLPAPATDPNYTWDTKNLPNGTYYIRGVIHDGVWPDTEDYSTGTVTVNNVPTAAALTITPAPVGNVGAITLSGLSDPNNDPLTVQFYYTTAAGGFIGNISNSSFYSPASPYSSPYTTITYNWNTKDVPDGDYLLFARISDGVHVVNFPVSVPPALGGTPFTVFHVVPVVSAVPNQVISGQGILPNSPPTALLEVQVKFVDAIALTSISAAVDFVPGASLSPGAISRLILYNSDGGIIDFQDNPVIGITHPFTLSDSGANQTKSYFIAVETSDLISHRDAFRVQFDGITYEGGSDFRTFVPTSSGAVTCESRIVDLMPVHSDVSVAPSAERALTGYPSTGTFFSPEEDVDTFTPWPKGTEYDQLLPMFKTTAVLGLDIAGLVGPIGQHDDEFLNQVIVTINPTRTPNFNPESAFQSNVPTHSGELGVTFWRDSNQNRLPDAGEMISTGGQGTSASEWLRLLTSGVAESGTLNSITDDNVAWATNIFSGAQVRIVSGQGKGQIRPIYSNTSDTINVSSWEADKFGNTPGAGSVYEILGNPWQTRLVGSQAKLGTNNNTIADTNQNWAVNQYVGAIVRILTNPSNPLLAVGEWSMISSNTSDTLSLDSGITGLDENTTYVIDEWSLIGSVDAAVIPKTTDGQIDYLVALCTGENVDFGSNFKIWIKPGDVKFAQAKPCGSINSYPINGLFRDLQSVKTIYANLKLHWNYWKNYNDLTFTGDYRRDSDYGSSTTYAPFRIDATSGPIPVLGINLTDGTSRLNTFDSIKVRFSGTGFQTTDLLALSDDNTSGVALYKDNKSGAAIGVWDATDTLVDISTDPQYLVWNRDIVTGEWCVTLKPVAGQDVPDDDVWPESGGTTNWGDDYFVCIRTSSDQPYQPENPGWTPLNRQRGIDFNDRIIVRVADHEVVVSDKLNAAGSGVTLRTIVANPPTFLTDVTVSSAIPANSGDIPVIGLNFVKPDTLPATDLFLSSLVVQFYSENDSFTMDDLKDFTASATTSGLALYKDNKFTGNPGVFDTSDTPVDLEVAPIVWQKFTGEGFYRVHLILKSPNEYTINHEADLLPNDVGDNAGPDYFLVIRTSNKISAGDHFVVRLMGSNVNGVSSSSDGLGSSKYLDTRAVGFTTASASVLPQPALSVFTVQEVNYNTLTVNPVPAADHLLAGQTLVFKFTTTAIAGNKIYLIQDNIKNPITGNSTITCYETNFNGDGVRPGDTFKVFNINYRSYERIIGRQLTAQTVTSTVLTDQIKTDFRVDATSDPFAFIGLNVYDASAPANTLNRVRVYFNPLTDGLTPDSALAPLSSDVSSGLAIYSMFESGADPFFYYNNTGVLQRGAGQVKNIITTAWKSDYENSFVDGDGTATGGAGIQEEILADTVLNKFNGAENIYWYDADGNTVWSSGDGLWIDGGDHIYQTGEPVIIAGSLADGVFGIKVDNGSGFAYYDNGATSGVYANGEDIYFLGRDRNILGYYTDLSLNPVASLPTDDSNHGPDFYFVFRTGDKIEYKNQFSFSIPSNAIAYSSGYSFANTDQTTNSITSRIPVFLTDLVESAASPIQSDQQKAVIGINLYDDNTQGNTISEINVYFIGTNVQVNLAALSLGTSSGVSLWKDNKSGGTIGVWDPLDTLITPRATPGWIGANRVRILLPITGAGQAVVPDYDAPSNSGADYFIVIKTAGTITPGNIIQAQIRSTLSTLASALPGEGIKFAGLPAADDSGEYLTTTNDLTTTMFSLTVFSDYDTPSPFETTTYNNGALITAGVTSPVAGPPGSGSRYVCTGWTGTGSVPATGIGTTVTFPIVENSTLTWNWKTQYYLTTTTFSGGGASTVSPATGYQDAGASVVVTATPASGFIFDHWVVDNVSSPVAVPFITVTMDAQHAVVAYFVPGATDAFQLYTIVSPDGSGVITITPDNGGIGFATGYYPNTPPLTDVVVTAYPGPGYIFNSWSGLGNDTAGVAVEGSVKNPITVTMDATRSLNARMTPIAYSLTADRLTTVENQGIVPENGTVGAGIFGVNASFSSTVYLKGLHFSLQVDPSAANPAFTTGMLDFLVYKDTFATTEGYFSKNDIQLATTIDWTPDPAIPGKYNVFLELTTVDTLPVSDTGSYSGYDYYLVLKTNVGLFNQARFTVTLNDVVVTDSSTGGGADSPCVPVGVLTTHNIVCEAKVTDLLGFDTDYDYSIPEEMSEPGKDYLLRGDRTFLLTQNEYVNYDTGLNISKLLYRPTVLPLDTPTAVLGIDVAGNAGTQVNPTAYQPEALDSIVITFKDTSGGHFNPQTNLNVLSAIDLTARGVAVYADEGDGIFGSAADFPLGINGYIWGTVGTDSTLQIFFDPTDANTVVPAAADYLNDFFVVLRLNPSNPSYGATFKTYINPADIKFKYVPVARQTALSIAEGNVSQGHAVFALSDLTPRYIDAASSPIPIVGLNFAFGTNSSDTFESIKVTLSGLNLTSNDLAAILGGIQPGGLMLYKDNKAAGQIGTFDPADTIVPIAANPWVNAGGGKFYGLVQPSTAISRFGSTLADDTNTLGFNNRGDDYFICLVTSDKIDYRDEIKVEVGNNDVQIHGHSSVSNGLFSKDGITPATFFDADLQDSLNPTPITANVPTFLTDISTGNVSSGGQPQGIIKIKARRPAGQNVYLRNLIVQITPGTGFSLPDLAAFTTGADGGLTVWKDNGDGLFDPNTDSFLPLSGITSISITPGEDYYRYELVLNNPQLLSDGTGGDSVFFVAVRTSSSMAALDSFQLRLWGSYINLARSRAFGYDTDTSDPLNAFTFEKITSRDLVCSGVISPYLRMFVDAPSTDEQDGNRSYTINWHVVRTGSGQPSGTISLYYDNDTNPTNKTWIATVPFSALSGSYVWDTRNVPRGTYYIYGQVTENAATSGDYSDGTVKINTRPLITVTAPSQLAEKALGQQYTIRWTAANLDMLSGPGLVDLYYRDGAVNHSIVTGRLVTDYSYLWNTGSVPDGIYYIYAVLRDSASTDTDLSVGSVDVRWSKQPAVMQVTKPDVTLGVIDGANDLIIYPTPPPPVTINRNRTLVAFKASDRVRWYDTNRPLVWDYTNDANNANDDAIWVDADNDGVYDLSETILAGNPNLPAGTMGVILTGLMPFSYKDNNANRSWNSAEPIVYEEFEDGNRRFSFSDAKVDVVFNSVPAGQLAGTKTHLDFYLDTDTNSANGFYLPDAIKSVTVLAGASLSGSINYDFSQLAFSQHGTYYIAMKVTDDNGWYPPVYYYSPAPVIVQSAPTLIITRPDQDTDIYSGSPFNLTYFASDPDSSAQFRIYTYDITDGDTFLILSGTLNTPSILGSFIWDAAAVGSIFPRDTYLMIKGDITDNVWLDTSQALGRVRILTQAPGVILNAESGSTSITLAWTDSTPVGETKEYLIYRQDVTAGTAAGLIWSGSRPFPPGIVLVDASTNTYRYVDSDLTLLADHTYAYYVVVQITEGVNSYTRQSNTVQAVLRAYIDVPTNLELVAVTPPVDVRWSWNNLVDIKGDAYGFVVERRGSLDLNWVPSPPIPGTIQAFGDYFDNSITDAMILRDPTYLYRVRAYRIYGTTGTIGYSDYSETRSITLEPAAIPISSSGGGGGGAVGPLAAGISALLGWWKRRRKIGRP